MEEQPAVHPDPCGENLAGADNRTQHTDIFTTKNFEALMQIQQMTQKNLEAMESQQKAGELLRKLSNTSMVRLTSFRHLNSN